MKISKKELTHMIHSKGVTQIDVCLLILAYLRVTADSNKIAATGIDCGKQEMRYWNFSSIFQKTYKAGYVIKIKLNRWQLRDAGKKYISEKFSQVPNLNLAENTNTLKKLEKLDIPYAKKFIDELIKVYKAGANRATVIMAWITTMRIVRMRIKECRKDISGGKLKDMSDGAFLDFIKSKKILDKNTVNLLIRELGVRNSCAHDNEFMVGKREVERYLEIFYDNIYNQLPIVNQPT